ncbi:hypothetical protein HA402_003413 [Bradysia odoriphaga]|nr:hypothetical protein HA402_003413 [Bradysia odoriphaga]
MNFIAFAILLAFVGEPASSFLLQKSVSNRICKVNDELKSVLVNLLNVTENVNKIEGELDHCVIFKTLLKATKEVRSSIKTDFVMSNILLGLISKTDVIPQASVCQLLGIIPGLTELLISTIKSNEFAEIRITATQILDNKTSKMEQEKLNCHLLDQVSQLFRGFDLTFFQNFLLGVTSFANKLVGNVLGTLGSVLG